MALQPPADFAPPLPERASPGQTELRALWRRQEAGRRERERAREWRAVQTVRRDRGGELRAGEGRGAPPAYLRESGVLGPHSRAALRPLPRSGRVLAAGVDTWSPCWYAEPGKPLARSLRALAIHQAARAWLLPEPVAGHRVGWFPDHGLVFAEGRPGGEALSAAAELPAAGRRLCSALADLGIPLAGVPGAGLRRLDVAADLGTDSAVEGLALLECVGAASPGAGVICAYRAGRRVESVLLKSRAGRTLARLYDKGAQSGGAPPGRWLRLEAQWHFPPPHPPAARRARPRRPAPPLRPPLRAAAPGGRRLSPRRRRGARRADRRRGRLRPPRPLARPLAGRLPAARRRRHPPGRQPHRL